MKVGEGEGEEAPGRIIYQLGEIFPRERGGRGIKDPPPLKNGWVRVLVTTDGSEMLCSTCTRLPPPLTLGTLRACGGGRGETDGHVPKKKINRAGILLGCEAERKIAIEG